MKPSLKALCFLGVLAFLLGLRFYQAQRDFQKQQAVFPSAVKGLFQVWVSEEPEVFLDHNPQSHDTGRLNGFYQPFVRETRMVCVVLSFNGAPVPPLKARCALRLSSRVSQPLLSYGQTVEIEGKIQPPSSAENPGQFDYARYLETKGVARVMYVTPGKWRVLEKAPLRGWAFLRWSYGLKRWAEDCLYRFLPYPENALLDGILLGERSPLPEEMVESFFLTGTIHILAVSGMITAFIAGLFFMVFRTLQLKRKWAAGMTLAALLFFIFMTGAHPPVCRAGLFSALALLGVLFERRIHGGVLLLTTAFVLLFFNPFALEDLSFQISFLATAGLMVMAPWFMEKLSFLPKPIALLVTATTAAQLAVWCLIIYDFNQLSVYSVLANLVIVPLALFSAAAGLTLLAGSLIHPALGTLFGAACEPALRLLIHLADWMATWPLAEWIVASPPLVWIFLFHALLLLTFLFFWPLPHPENPSLNWKKRREGVLNYRRWVLRAWILFTVSASLTLLISSLKPQPLRVTFLAVGHGNAVVLQSPEGKVFIVDGGKETRGPDRYLPLVAYLRHQGIRKVVGILNTHPDEDHVGGLVNVVSAYPVLKAYEGAKAQSSSEIYHHFKEELQMKGVPLTALSEGETLNELNPVHLKVVHPPFSYNPPIHPDNNRSVVSLVSWGGFHLVLPGDLEKPGILETLKNNKPFPPVDWLMAPHHGRSSGQPALCAKGFQPRFVVLSDWKDYPEARAIYQKSGEESVVLSTALDGAIEVEVNEDGTGRYRTFQNKDWKKFSSEGERSRENSF